MQRIDRDDRRERGHATGDVVAFGDERLADTAADRRRDPRETQVELGGIQRSLRGIDLRLARIQCSGRRVEAIACDDLLGEQLFGPRMVCLGEHRCRFGLAQARRRGVQRGLEHPGIDDEETAALLDEAPLGHAHVLDVAADTRAQFDPLDCGERAGELDEWRHRTDDHLGHRNVGGLGGGGSRCRFLAAGDHERERDAHCRSDRGYAFDLHLSCLSRRESIWFFPS
ncbi:hypothetical protein D9M72_327630 [compost metagenome]